MLLLLHLIFHTTVSKLGLHRQFPNLRFAEGRLQIYYGIHRACSPYCIGRSVEVWNFRETLFAKSIGKYIFRKFSGFSFFHFSLFWQGSTQWMMPAVFPLPSKIFIFLIFFFFLMIDINDDLIVFFFLVPRRPKLLMLSHPSIA